MLPVQMHGWNSGLSGSPSDLHTLHISDSIILTSVAGRALFFFFLSTS